MSSRENKQVPTNNKPHLASCSKRKKQKTIINVLAIVTIILMAVFFLSAKAVVRNRYDKNLDKGQEPVTAMHNALSWLSED